MRNLFFCVLMGIFVYAADTPVQQEEIQVEHVENTVLPAQLAQEEIQMDAEAEMDSSTSQPDSEDDEQSITTQQQEEVLLQDEEQADDLLNDTQELENQEKIQEDLKPSVKPKEKREKTTTSAKNHKEEQEIQFSQEDLETIPESQEEEIQSQQELIFKKTKQMENSYYDTHSSLADILDTGGQIDIRPIKDSALQRDSEQPIIDKQNELRGIKPQKKQETKVKKNHQSQEKDSKSSKKKNTKNDKKSTKKNPKKNNTKTSQNKEQNKEQNQEQHQQDKPALNQKKQMKDFKTLEEKQAKQVVFSQEEVYELDHTDFALVQNRGSYAIKILSAGLENFVYGQGYNTPNQVQTFSVNNNYTQIVNKNGRIKEYHFYQKKSKQGAFANRVIKYPLEKMDLDLYKIIIKNPPALFDITKCRVTRSKELNTNLITNQEVMIDLNIKRELRNIQNYKLFLECPR